MDRLLKYVVLLCSLVCIAGNVYATHAAGGELLYERVPGTSHTYRFILKFYRDCRPGSAREPQTVKMCYANRCGTQNQSRVLQKWTGLLPDGRPNGSPVTTGCIATPTTCAGGTLPGYQEWWYTDTITISDICDNWRFWVSISARNGAITNLNTPTQQSIYIEAMLNNSVSPDNNSPYFHTAPIPYCCVGYPFSYDNGAIDPDGDSLVFESIRPRTGSNNNNDCFANPANIPYTSAQYNPINNPFASGNTFQVDPAAGVVSFTPTIQQVVVVTVKVSEYRNGQLIGYVIRDIQIVANACNSPLTNFSVDPTSVQGGAYHNSTLTVTSCVGRELRFCFDISSPAVSAELVPSDDHQLSLPGASLTYSNVRTNSVRGCVVWPLNASHVGAHTLHIDVTDSSCLPFGFIPAMRYSVPIIISEYSPVYATVKRTICDGQSYLGYTQTGIYLDTFTNYLGCDSIHTLELSVNPTYIHTVYDTICANKLPVLFGTRLIATAGAYTELFAATSGCDSTVTLNMAVIQPTDTVINMRICRGAVFEGYSNPGSYQDVFVNAAGCDSVRTINLNWFPSTDTVIQQTICYNESFQGYDQTGIYLDTFINRFGCDSVRTIQLTVHPLRTGSISRTICPGDTYLGYSQAGTYIDTLVSSLGCDSVRILQLQVNPVLYETIDTTICFGMTHDGYGVSGTYVDTFTSSFQCDSIRTLHLTLRSLADTNIYMEICEGDAFLGYQKAGYYEDTLMAHSGCDSIRRLTLVVHPVFVRDTVVYICEDEAYFTQGAPRQQSGIYRDSFVTSHGCDSIWVIDLRTTERLYPDLGPNKEICDQDTIVLYPGAYRNYSWNTGETGERLVVYQSGTYSVKVYNFEGCAASDSVHVLVRSLPDVTIINHSDGSCMGDTMHLSGQGAAHYEWSNNAAVVGQNEHYSFVPITNHPINIKLTGTDQYGCTASESIQIAPVNCCDIGFVPSAFTPNGDGLNDQFRVVSAAFFKEFRMVILDRWGNTVFETNDIASGWNGKTLNTDAPPAVYFYMIRVVCYDDHTEILKGDVTLIR